MRRLIQTVTQRKTRKIPEKSQRELYGWTMPTLRCSTTIRDTYTDGRLTGLNPGSDYGVSYGYDSYGRVETINAQVAGTGTQTYTYSDLQNSDLLNPLPQVTG